MKKVEYMFKARYAIIAILLFVLSAVTLTTMAGDCGFADGRITQLANHFGNDALFCDPVKGCELLNGQGVLLLSWSQADIEAGLAELDEPGEAIILGQGQGSHGPALLYVNKNMNSEPQLCLQGFDEWGKQNEVCFSTSYVSPNVSAWTTCVEQRSQTQSTPASVADCSAFRVGDNVFSISENAMVTIISINSAAGTATVQLLPLPLVPPSSSSQVGKAPATITVSCDDLTFPT